MFATIIPFLHSIGTQPLLYSVPETSFDQLEIGQIVMIPYGNSSEHGIIAGLYLDSPIDTESETYTRIKNIETIITSKKILAPYQIEMISAISERYLIPIHRVLGIFLSRPILSRLEKKEYQQIIDSEVVSNGDTKGAIHLYQEDIIRPEHIADSLQDTPTIIILPDDFAMIPYQEYFSQREDILFMRNDMTDTRRAQAWIDIRNGVFSTIYGTRKILYYNLSRYNHIIYVEDALGPDYWHYPIKINYIDILRIFEKTHPNLHLTILSSVPTLALLNYFRHFEIKNISKNTHH